MSEEAAEYKRKKIVRTRDYRQMQMVRLEIVSELFKKGYTYRVIRQEVMKRLDLQSYSLDTVKKDVDRCLKEIRSVVLTNMDEALNLELIRIDDMMREAWAAWEKSKEDYLDTQQIMRGTPKQTGKGEESGVDTTSMEQRRKEIRSCGDPRYLELINKLLIERRKLLGLYAPEKKELSGSVSFTDLLMATSAEPITDDEQ